MSITTSVSRTATERDLLYFITPELWPTWPFLPIVRYRPDGEMDYGVLYDCRDESEQESDRWTVYVTNLFTMPPTKEKFLALPKKRFQSVEELAAAGWVVD